MTIAEMRTLLGLGSEISDAAVVDAYVVYLDGAPPATEPVSLAQARNQLGMTDDSDTSYDELVGGLIVAARQMVEGYTGLSLTQRQIVQHASRFEDLRLRASPIQSVDAVTYIDGAGVEQVLTPAAWSFVPTASRCQLRLTAGAAWPGISWSTPDAITIVATAGYAAPDQVPWVLRKAMLILITALFDQLDGGSLEMAEKAAKSMCQPYVRYS